MALWPACFRRGIGAALLIIDEDLAGMTLFQQAHDTAEAKANKTLAAAEKSDEMLDLSYEQMLDQITRRRIDMGTGTVLLLDLARPLPSGSPHPSPVNARSSPPFICPATAD
jgi:hypothetical protein